MKTVMYLNGKIMFDVFMIRQDEKKKKEKYLVENINLDGLKDIKVLCVY